jgi:hypothetical protein
MHAVSFSYFPVFLNQSLNKLVVVLEDRPVEGGLLGLVFLVKQRLIQTSMDNREACKDAVENVDVTRGTYIVQEAVATERRHLILVLRNSQTIAVLVI